MRPLDGHQGDTVTIEAVDRAVKVSSPTVDIARIMVGN
jgi:hypothetical protein